MEKAGYFAQSIKDFTDVYGQMMSADVDLILLDISLPEENGEILLQKFRKHRDTPVIMLTSRTGDIDEAVSMSYGADDYITKPYNPTILLLRISAVLKRTAKSGQTQSYNGVLVSGIKGSLIKDRLFAFVTWAVSYILTIIFLLAFRVNSQLILDVTVIDVMAVTFHELWNFYRKKGFYDRLGAIAEALQRRLMISLFRWKRASSLRSWGLPTVEKQLF